MPRWSAKRLLRRPRMFRRTAPGARPGEFRAPEEAPRPSIQAIGVRRERVEVFDIAAPAELAKLRDEWPLLWVNVVGLGDVKTLQGLRDMFGVHPLAMEDIAHVHQRAKVDEYGEQLYIVVRMVNPHEGRLTEQVSMLLSEGLLITFQERPGDAFEQVRSHLKTDGSPLREHGGADYLAYRLIDATVDGYFPVLESLGDRLDRLDDETTNHPGPEIMAEIHQLRSELLLLRRVVWPHREAVHALMWDARKRISDSTRTHLRDVYDHTVQLVDLVETYRDLCTDLRDYYLTVMSHRMNEIMKVLTVIATIFIPLSFVAGLYGMNFNPEVSRWNMPELNWRYGYPFALGLMAIVAGGMLWFFWRKGWLGSFAERPRGRETRD